MLGAISGLDEPIEPEKELNSKPPTLSEIAKVVQKGRSKSAPGPNGIPYLLYKKCPEVLKWLHKLIRSAWRNEKIPQQWMCADGVYIPKEQNSSDINQFRPISLLNIEGKIFFAVMAARLTNYLLENQYIDTSIQKGGIPGIPGCLEHATMIWETIQRAKSSRKNLDVVWLDLANAYGSVPHDLIQLALKMHHVPPNICTMIKKYFDGFHMRFSTQEYTTEWVGLNVGIAMGCTISPILFVLVMEIMLRGAGKDAKQIEPSPGWRMSPLRAFMDDMTVLSETEAETRSLLENLDRFISWARMSFKPKKSRCLSLRKGKMVEVSFQVAGQDIPTVKSEPVKSLGRWYDASLKDTQRGVETMNSTIEGLHIIDKSGLQAKHKLWCLQFMLIPKLLWPLLVYDICISTVEKIESKINKFTRRWLGVPPGLTDVALYCRQAKLKLPLKSVTEEYKTGKVRLHSMLEYSQDEVVRLAKTSLKTGRKWKVDKVVKGACEELRLKEIMGHTQNNRQGLGCTEMKWWSKAEGKEKRDMVIQEVRQEEDMARLQKAVQQSQQGQWTSWETAIQRSLTWNDIWHMSPLRTSFILRSTYDLLPSNKNLVKWGKTSDPNCPLCGGIQTVEHVLSSCKTALADGRYTWRHNRVLEQLAEAVRTGRGKRTSSETAPFFLKEGGKEKWIGVQRKIPQLSEDNEWEISVDLPSWEDYPPVIKRSRL